MCARYNTNLLMNFLIYMCKTYKLSKVCCLIASIHSATPRQRRWLPLDLPAMLRIAMQAGDPIYFRKVILSNNYLNYSLLVCYNIPHEGRYSITFRKTQCRQIYICQQCYWAKNRDHLTKAANNSYGDPGALS